MKKMNIVLAAALLAGVSACKKEEAAEAPAKPPSAPTEAQPEAEKPTEAPAPEAARPKAPECVFDGDYRVAFTSNGSEGWWFRFTVAGDKATLTNEVGVLAMKPGDLTLTKEVDGCKLTIGGTSSAVGTMSMALAHNLGEGTVSGTLTREAATSEAEKSTQVEGAFDAVGTKRSSECFTPGLYKLAFDEKEEWKNSEADDDRDCKAAPRVASPVIVNLEHYGKGVSVTAHNSWEPYEEGNAAKTENTGECEVKFSIADESLSLDATLTLSKDGVKGNVSKADYQFVEDGTAGESIWNCIGENVTLTGVPFTP